MHPLGVIKMTKYLELVLVGNKDEEVTIHVYHLLYQLLILHVLF